jgi:hypothetical protein
VAAVSGALGATFGYRAAVAGRQAVEEARLALAEARTARNEERLYRELAGLERLTDLLKRMLAVLNRASTWRTPASSPETEKAKREAWQELDGLLYALRAALSAFDKDDLSRCRHLVDGADGQALLGGGDRIQAAENEVEEGINRCRGALRTLVQVSS